MPRRHGLNLRYAYPWNLGPLVPPSGVLVEETANVGTPPIDIGDEIIYGPAEPTTQPEIPEDEE